ncbi:MAG: MoaD/ThiS family protein [Bacteroidota bacterium]|nr:MoaD/ThiS family protein [Bacteroidota bacterium]
MAQVTVTLPALLKPFAGQAGKISLKANTVHGALMVLCGRFPSLKPLMFDEEGALRTHVLCFHNESNSRWSEEGLCRPLKTGDQLTIIQAVAGG